MTAELYAALQAMATAPSVIGLVLVIAAVLVGCSLDERRRH